MKIIDNVLTKKHHGKAPELESRLKKVRNDLVTTSRLAVPNGEEFLHLGHSPEYIAAMRDASRETGNFYGTHFSPGTYDSAVAGVGASILGARTGSFVLTRPPGHHAGHDLPTKRVGLGDCVFNNMAIAAKSLRDDGQRVLVLDIDLHQGNGTQDILKDEPDIAVVDTSQWGYWPWYDNGSENCVNIYFNQGVGDEEYLKGLERGLAPILREFKPDIIGISAGFDTSRKDRVYLADSEHPDDLAHFDLTDKSLGGMRDLIGDCPRFAILEGGYNPGSVSEGVGILTGD